MNILVDVGHPAHVHLFRNAIHDWRENGHHVVIAARDKDIAAQLLAAYGLDYVVASRARRGLAGLFVELLEHDWSVLQMARRHQSEVLLGTSVAIAHASRFLPACSIVFNEDDIQAARAFAWLTYPFADAIVTPSALPDDLGEKHIRYDGYQELAYLHPSQFAADRSIFRDLGVADDERYSMVRLTSFQAAHDRGQEGIGLGTRRALIRLLSEHGPVFITAEGSLPDEFAQYQICIEPHKIHDAMAFASIFVSDSQTMTIEAALLGTPAIRCNTFVGRCSVIGELEDEYGLAYGFLPRDAGDMLEKIRELLNDGDLHRKWQEKRRKMLDEKVNLTAWMVDFIENYPGSADRDR